MLKRVCLAALTASLLAAAPKVIAVDIDGVIHPITVDLLAHALDQAASQNASAVLVRLNTPGGLLDATRQMNEKIVASRVPVIAYVTPSGGRAASAGFFILEAADVAAMAPGTNTGASSPVALTGQMDETMRHKVENDASAWLRSTVEKRGRNVELAETTIRQASSFTEKEALDKHLIDLIAPSEQKLFEDLDGRTVTRFDGRQEVLHVSGAEVVPYSLTLRERVISSIADPNIGFILLIVGALGLYVEFNSPGLILPGVAGGILLLMGVSSLAVLPLSWVGVSLLLLGCTLFVLEAHFASHGVLGIGGTVALILGALMLVNGPPEMQIRLVTALSVSIPFALITMFLLSLAIRARRNKSLMGGEGVLHEIGEARTALAPAGKVFVHGEYWDAVSSTPVEAGGEVRVIAVDGMKLKVEPRAIPPR